VEEKGRGLVVTFDRSGGGRVQGKTPEDMVDLPADRPKPCLPSDQNTGRPSAPVV